MEIEWTLNSFDHQFFKHSIQEAYSLTLPALTQPSDVLRAHFL